MIEGVDGAQALPLRMGSGASAEKGVECFTPAPSAAIFFQSLQHGAKQTENTLGTRLFSETADSESHDQQQQNQRPREFPNECGLFVHLLKQLHLPVAAVTQNPRFDLKFGIQKIEFAAGKSLGISFALPFPLSLISKEGGRRFVVSDSLRQLRRLDSFPCTIHIDLRPRMGVALLHGDIVFDAVGQTSLVTGDDACREPGQTAEGDEGRREVDAIPIFHAIEKIVGHMGEIQRIGLQRIGQTRLFEKLFDRMETLDIVGKGFRDSPGIFGTLRIGGGIGCAGVLQDIFFRIRTVSIIESRRGFVDLRPVDRLVECHLEIGSDQGAVRRLEGEIEHVEPPFVGGIEGYFVDDDIRGFFVHGGLGHVGGSGFPRHISGQRRPVVTSVDIEHAAPEIEGAFWREFSLEADLHDDAAGEDVQGTVVETHRAVVTRTHRTFPTESVGGVAEGDAGKEDEKQYDQRQREQKEDTGHAKTLPQTAAHPPSQNHPHKHEDFDDHIDEHRNRIEKEEGERKQKHRRECEVDIDLPCHPLQGNRHDEQVDEQFDEEFQPGETDEAEGAVE